ncbi:MAG: hypothetical protein AAF411_16265 [Myxococcota bacterium]
MRKAIYDLQSLVRVFQAPASRPNVRDRFESIVYERTMRSLALCLLLAACGPSETSVEPVTPPPSGDESPPESPEASAEDDNLIVGTDACTSDADCVPAQCCHAAACVAQDAAPSCEDTMCTQECRYGTLDCGGSCLCHEGRCAARVSEVPAAIREQVEAQGETGGETGETAP